MPQFTKIPKEFRLKYKEKFTLSNNEEVERLAKEDPVIFGYYYLGKKTRLHQAYIMYRFLILLEHGHVRLAMCLARQLGKSITACILLIWLCWYNKQPATIAHVTIWYVISRDDDAAKEFLGKMRLLLHEGDRHMAKFTDKTDYFTSCLKEPNNTEQLTFLNDCFIKSIPPTKKALGKSGNAWIDEAHRLKCIDMTPDDFFDLLVAITAETGGAIVLSSSPEGLVGFFHRAIDPDNHNPENEYEGIWWDHTIWDDGTEECKRYQEHVQKEKKRMIAAGRLAMWHQEYGALFTVQESAFFTHEEINNAVKDTPKLYEYKDTPCSLSLDYGSKISRTTLTIRTMINEEIIQIFQFRGKAGFDNNLLRDPSFENSIPRFLQRYNIQWIYGDDCANGNDTNNWIKKNIDVPLFLYNFRSDQMSKKDGLNRNCTAYAYKSRLKEGKLKIPKWNKTQQFEMKTIQETEGKVFITIKAPQGQLCDTFDSDMMACIPFLDMNSLNSIEFDTGNDDKNEFVEVVRDFKNPRTDSFKPLTDEQCQDMIKEINEEDNLRRMI